ncbi:MAG: hypothetical protein HY609_03530 [Deltaproteobacteria bacterium]|nr:hypothetical protein [Deltaproteobacteria bacterium]MBI4223980.1 hypothetical protein [Deltaproteobacteria bacterium]
MGISKVHSAPKQTRFEGEKHLPKDDVEPKVLLEDLKEKQRLFAQLKEEGLIHKDKHLLMEQKLKETIAELEDLIPQLEVA